MPYRDPYFRLLIEHSTDAIALVNKEGHLIYVSPAIEQILGYTPQQFLKVKPTDIIHTDELGYITQIAASATTSRGKTINFICRAKHTNGTWRWIDVTCTNLFHVPELQAVVINFRDITEQKEIESRKDEFISVASHELKTPLATLKGFSQILISSSEKISDPRILYFSHKINDQIDRLSALVNDLLDVSKIQAGKLSLNKENFEIDNLIREITVDMQNIITSHKIEIKLSANTKICADKYRISQVMANLISNAVKYSPNAKTILITSKRVNGHVEICVMDFGIGIFKKDISHIFERFYQARNKIRKSFSGLGLGLYICSEILKQHNGKIWVESEKGIGSTFFIKLPVK